MYEKFSKLLCKTNKTSYQVSKDTGIAQSVLSDWKRGRSKPKAEKLKILADYFGVSVDYFLEQEGLKGGREVETMESYKNAERLAEEILKMCTEKGITLKELQMLKTALPIAIDQKVEEYLSRERLS